MTKEIYLGDTIRLTATIYDFDKVTKIDPNTHEIKLWTPAGAQQGETMTSPTRDALGEFHQDVTIPEAGVHGMWKVTWKAVKGTVVKFGVWRREVQTP